MNNVIINREKCRGCGKCAVRCPQRAIDIIKGKSQIKRDKCIVCNICSDCCPYNAIQIVEVTKNS